jgi:hypothetical protein
MDLTSLTPLPGSRSGETFLGQVGADRCVVRIYAAPRERGDAAAEIDAALLRLVRGLLPVPDVLEVRRPDPATGLPGLLVTSYVDGVRADELLPGLDDDGLARAGAALGDLAAALAAMPLLRPGRFLDGDLTVGPWPDDRDPDPATRCCLVHGALDPRHVLLDPDTLAARALLGWRAAYAGHPLTDLGPLLDGGLPHPFREAVATAYAARHGGTPEQLLALP